SIDQKTAATHQLGLCEGSDWFWWFGDYNPASVVRDFEQLYRRHLANLYERIGYPAPSSLFQPRSQGGGEPAKGGAMRPGHEASSCLWICPPIRFWQGVVPVCYCTRLHYPVLPASWALPPGSLWMFLQRRASRCGKP